MSELQQLVPFVVELIPPDELPIQEFVDELTIHGQYSPFLSDISRRQWPIDLVEKYKNIPDDRRSHCIMLDIYRQYHLTLQGEWLVVGVMGPLYLAAQPKRLVERLPIELCRFIRLYNDVSFQSAC